MEGKDKFADGMISCIMTPKNNNQPLKLMGVQLYTGGSLYCIKIS